jgi:hypothetical protein
LLLFYGQRGDRVRVQDPSKLAPNDI